jgi:non-specific serine/threonine protein kinase
VNSGGNTSPRQAKQTARRAHAACFVAWDERLDPNATGPGERFADRLRRIDAEHPNLRAALAYLREVGDAAGVLRLAGALAVFWHHRDHLAEGRQWLEWALAHTAETPTIWRGRALAGLSLVAWSQRDLERAESLAEAALAVAEAIDDRELAALAIHLLGIVELVRGRLDRARELMETTLELQRALGSRSDGAMALMVLSEIAFQGGDLHVAAGRAEEALANFRALGHPSGEVNALSVLARLALNRGDDHRAAAAYQEMLGIWSAFAAGNSPSDGSEEAGFPSWTNVDDRVSVRRALAGLAGIAAAHGQPEAAATLVGALDVLWDRTTTPNAAPNRAHPDRVAAATRAILNEERLAELRESGRGLPLAAVIAVAMGITVSAPPGRRLAPSPKREGAEALTTRELDVLRLLIEGRSNAEIADALFVGVRTARMHVANILAKFGVATRTAAAAHAIRHGLV